MRLEQYIDGIRLDRRSEKPTPLSSFRLIEEALSWFPSSSKLYCILGDSIQLGGNDCPYELGEALLCYEKALELDPKCSEAHESVGYYYSVIDEDLERAENAFRKALAIEKREDSYTGLARVLSERGTDRETIIRMLDESPFPNSDKVLEIREEIIEGLWTK